MKMFPPDHESCNWEQFFYFILYALQGIQGIFFTYLTFYSDPRVRKEILQMSINGVSKCKICTKKARKKFSSESDPNTPELPLDINQMSTQELESKSEGHTKYCWQDIAIRAINQSEYDSQEITPTPMKRVKRPSMKEIVMRATSVLKRDISVSESVHESPDGRRSVTRSARESTSETSNSSRKSSFFGLKSKETKANNRRTSPSPPKILPKTIPDEILDDVQLFELYYQNLDKIVSTDPNSHSIVSLQSSNSDLQIISELDESPKSERLRRHTSLQVKSHTEEPELRANVKRLHSLDSASSSVILDGNLLKSSMDSVV